MKQKKKIVLTLGVMLILSISSFCQRVTPYQGSRLFWDISSETTVFPSGNYARMVELRDGRLIAVAEALGGISVTFSSNKGSTWTTPRRIVAPPAKVFYAVPDVIQLTDGTILVGLNPRPNSPYSEDRLFGIRVIRSTDNGESWSEPLYVFDANHTFNDGCWEPAFLELPSGEVQCYFANEGPYTMNNDQEISVCRSFDKGKSWSDPVTVCYRKGYRDGMPAPILLRNPDEIAVIVEDNGWPGRGNFAATIVRTTLEDNWTNGYVDATSSRREMIFETTPATSIYSAAPYLRTLPWGETVASYQSNERRTSSDLQYADMYVVVGDERARNFKAKSAPFYLGHDKHAIWNSVSVIDTGIVVALASIGPPNKSNDVLMIKGYPIRQARASYGSITVDAVISSDEKWTTSDRSQLFFGSMTKGKTIVDFSYDDQYLYLFSRVIDRNIINTKSDNDGLRFLIDADDISGSAPQEGMYSFFFDTNGTVKFQRAQNGFWKTDQNMPGIQYALNVQSFYYTIEAAIPWELLGKSIAPEEKRMAIALEVVNRDDYSMLTEGIADVNKDASWTWLEFRLTPRDESGMATPSQNISEIKIYSENNILFLDSSCPIEELSVFTFDGRLVTKRQKAGRNFQIPLPLKGGGIVKLNLEDGSCVVRKIYTGMTAGTAKLILPIKCRMPVAEAGQRC